MDFGILVQYWPRLWQGILVTLELGAVVLVLGTILALFVALGRLSSNPWIAKPFAVYSSFLRSVPVLVILYFTYYALPQFGLCPGVYTVAIGALSIATSAYMGEIFKAGIVAIRPEQYEAARSLGLSWVHTMRRIILPQAFRIILPPYMSQAIIVAKGTSIAGVLAITELTGTAWGLMAKTHRPFEILFFVTAAYLLMTSSLVALQAYVEKRWKMRY